MSTTHVLVSLAGAIALLLWGIHMVHSGVLRAFGADLRHLLGRALKTRLHVAATSPPLAGRLGSFRAFLSIPRMSLQ